MIKLTRTKTATKVLISFNWEFVLFKDKKLLYPVLFWHGSNCTGLFSRRFIFWIRQLKRNWNEAQEWKGKKLVDSKFWFWVFMSVKSNSKTETFALNKMMKG